MASSFGLRCRAPSPACGGGLGRGPLCQRSGDGIQNTGSVGHDVVIVEAKDTKALAPKKSISACITPHILGFEMLAAIQLDDKLSFVTHEVDDVRSDWGLTSEARSV
jgi:hypothetical protein